MFELRAEATAHRDWIRRAERLTQDSEARLRRSEELQADGAGLLTRACELLMQRPGPVAPPLETAV